ncbi:MAG: pre-mRNA-splicing factor syf2 [Caeruleum heppii]|nr:MAG: pre-mRNA-splicing factor syf2 [Caeruleum heppii]
MPPSKKRKMNSTTKVTKEAKVSGTAETTTESPSEAPLESMTKSDGFEGSEKSESDGTTAQPNAQNTAAARAQERQEKFKALQARAKKSSERNLKETAAESRRLAADPGLLSSLARKQAVASHNLLKADTTVAGEDFERKRAWDWTVEDSKKWDKRLDKKQRHRDDVAFQDYRQEARKAYKRQLRDMKPDLEAYENSKMAAIQKAAKSGGLEIVETLEGELVAVDQDGTFYSTADSTDFVENRPDRAGVDRLVNDLNKAEDMRMKKRRDRGKGDTEGDVTFINEKNRQFNQKLARAYNKYTSEIRDSFERGTMI